MILWIKILHMSCALLTISGFFVRGVWMLRDSPLLQARWVKVLPHGIDSVLLLSGVTLAVLTQQNPMVQHWLLAKIVLLLLYIVLGSIALKYGRSKKQKILAWVAALVVVMMIVSIARSHQVNFFGIWQV